MKTASILIQTLALSACFTIHFAHAGGAQMNGVRRALQTITSQGSQTGGATMFAEADPAAEMLDA